MITYSDLYETLRKEKYNENLQHIPKNFMQEIEEYFSDKRGAVSKESDIFSEEIKKSKKQLDNAVEIVKELMRRREEKVLKLALLAAKIGISKKDIENMLEHERELFTYVAEKVEGAEKKLSSIMNGAHENNFKNKLVRFIEDTSEFLDLESRAIGPFKKGDIANLPAEITNILISAKQAALIEE